MTIYTSPERAVDKEARKADHSGKKKATADNIIVMINYNGVILGLSDYAPDNIYDLTPICESISDLDLQNLL